MNGDSMEGQVVELTEAEQAQHQLQMEQQLKAFWAKQLLEVGPCDLRPPWKLEANVVLGNASAQMEQLEVGSEQGAWRFILLNRGLVAEQYVAERRGLTDACDAQTLRTTTTCRWRGSSAS